MFSHVDIVKEKLSEAISQLCEVSWMFAKDPNRNFTRKRKLPFEKVISFLLAMEGGTLTTELLKYFGCSGNTASSSALVQQRNKIDPNLIPGSEAYGRLAAFSRKKGGVHIPGGLCQINHVQLYRTGYLTRNHSEKPYKVCL